jgi:hypothetical protein
VTEYGGEEEKEHSSSIYSPIRRPKKHPSNLHKKNREPKKINIPQKHQDWL